jgi:hypothetical protein
MDEDTTEPDRTEHGACTDEIDADARSRRSECAADQARRAKGGHSRLRERERIAGACDGAGGRDIGRSYHRESGHEQDG